MDVRNILLFSTLFMSSHAGDLTISYAPDSLRFGHASPLRSSSLDDMLAAAMGYTPATSPWSGLTVTSPFKHPTAMVVVGIDGSGSAVQEEGQHYTLQEDKPFINVYGALHSAVSARAQRPTHFVHMEVADGAGIESEQVSSPSDSTLVASREPDASFLLEVGVLPSLIDKAAVNSSVPHGGQDFIFYQLESFALLVKTYGDNSPQVQEGKQLLRSAIDRLVSRARSLYADQVLVVSAVTDKSSDTLSRASRSVLAADDNIADVNLAKEYSEDYPVIFNIILFLSLVLIIALLGVSAAMAYMDPGRDSIIYRMTNPRMKKDQ
ncbi:Renin receptor-like [Trinorchestia longiramus]|nr:Renin receptor-like [Trinorchestia longiramus]